MRDGRWAVPGNWLVRFTLVLATFVSSPSFAGVWISGIAGDASQYLIERGGDPIPARIYANLRDGDSITVLDGKGRLTLEYDDGHVANVTRRDSPFVVRDAGAPPDWSANLSTWVAGLFGEAEGAAGREQAVALMSRGPGSLQVPMLGGRRGRLGQGSQQIYLQWTGDAPGYQLKLRQLTEQAEVIAVSGISGTRFRIGPVDLRPGVYVLTLKGKSKSFVAEIRVVETKDIPTPPADLMPDSLPAAMRATLAADWLANTGKGAWRFLAYQRLALQAESYEPARRLLEKLGRP